MAIAQGITLTTYGNAFLKKNYDISELTLDHSAFSFHNKVNFHIIKKGIFTKAHWIEYSPDPIDWLNKLKKAGCLELRMVFESDNTQADDHMLAAFAGGGGHRFIETVFDYHSDFWKYKTELTKKDDPDKKIWTSSYGRVLTRQKTKTKLDYNINTEKEKLRLALQNIIAFANAESENNWSEIFQKAMACLDETVISEKLLRSKSLPKEKMTLPIMQLYGSAIDAYVFGGMGSWNDLIFKTKESNNKYKKLSAELYSVINECYLAIANS